MNNVSFGALIGLVDKSITLKPIVKGFMKATIEWTQVVMLTEGFNAGQLCGLIHRILPAFQYARLRKQFF
jgi:hypothetical protein